MFGLSRSNGPQKKVLVTQDDFYDDAVAKEEQAERWALSDIKKTIRQYLLAFESYERGLNAAEATLSGSCHIYYNQTRLLLKMHTDFIANDGHINILQYVNLSDLGDLTVLFQPLGSITERFELAFAKFGDICSWDLHFNLLTCYYSRIENFETVPGQEVLHVFEKFRTLSQKLIELHVQELETWDVANADGLSNVESYEDTAKGPDQERDQEPEAVEMQDEITVWTLIDTLAVSYRCIAAVLELFIESSSGTLDTLNAVQADWLSNNAQEYKSQLDNFLANTTHIHEESADTGELKLAIWSIEALRIATDDGFEGLKTLIADLPNEDTGRLLIAVDVLHLAGQPSRGTANSQLWAIYTEIGRVLRIVDSQLAAKRQDITSGRLKHIENELSPTVFHLCDVLINRSDNELFRYMIKTSSTDTSTSYDGSSDPNAAKTAAVLLKNAQVLLKNAKAISQQSCGFREYISDKLKRNYIYKQAEDRLEFIESHKTTETISELAQNHPFYATNYSFH
ncbi:uncharacterized protein LALA0_S12e03312g [Lachancea lanzarotensis]|uniref:LALA0S12e03312g1_1 n=1 Tax=Lachancea lanzarotensis TaxID=1245769 RepID=A0A0C7N9T9_9SACH|nr:uncharacterized protein LALA0_S12e03312g [Lachancea lanzarotensis]CEP64630.1 LALA0S12e03312g1_1 [Lachancea lanzarotensis]